MAASSVSDPERRWPWRVAVLVLLVGWMAFPLDAPWINDEPHLLLRALDANAAGELPWLGLQSQRGTQYGPLGLWVDQLLLFVTHDIAWIVSLRALLFGAVLAGSLAWLARTLGVTRWLVVATLASPWMWFYARLVWDNSWNIPLAALTVAAYASFVVHRRASDLVLTAATGTLMVLCHLMCGPLLLGIAFHALWCRRGDLGRHAVKLAIAVAVLAVLSAPYWQTALSGAFAPAEDGSIWKGALYPLSAPRHLMAGGLSYVFGADWLAAWPALLRWPYLVCLALSISVAFWCIEGALNAVTEPSRDESEALRRSLARLGLVVIALHCVVGGLTRTHGDPHHLNATWIGALLIVWSAVQSRIEKAPGRPRALAVSLAIVLGVSTLLVAGRVHATSGTRGPRYGPTLRAQLPVARLLARLPPNVRIETDVPHIATFPHALQALVRLEGRSTPTSTAQVVVIRWASRDPLDARLEPLPR